MKQVEIIADFIVGNNLDPELLLETMEAAMKDILFDMHNDVQTANWGASVDSVEIKLGI